MTAPAYAQKPARFGLDRAKRAIGLVRIEGSPQTQNAVCIDPSGIYATAGLASTANAPFILTIQTDNGLLNVPGKVVALNQGLCLLQADAPEVISVAFRPSSVADGRPIDPPHEVSFVGFVTANGPNPAGTRPEPEASPQLRVEPRHIENWRTEFAPAPPPLRQPRPGPAMASAAIFDSEGLLAALAPARPGMPALDAAYIQSALKGYLDSQRNNAAVSAGGAAHYNSRKSLPMPPRIAPALAAVAFTQGPAGNRVGCAICIDSSGYFLTAQAVAVPAQPTVPPQPPVILVQSMPDRTESQLRATVIASEGGLTLLKVETDSPLPAAETADISPAAGAMYATELVYQPAGIGSGAASEQWIVRRGQLRWPVSPGGLSAFASLSRVGYIGQFGNALVFDDSGRLVGFSRGDNPPDGVNVTLVTELRRILKAPLISLLPVSLTAVGAHQDHDFTVKVLGLDPGRQAGLRMTLSSGPTDRRSYPAEQYASGIFVVRAPPLPPSVSAASRLSYEITLDVDGVQGGLTVKGELAITGTDSNVVAADNARLLSRQKKLVIPLPSPGSPGAVAGNGRYLLIPCLQAHKLVVLDVHQLTVRTIDVRGEKFSAAGGAEKMLLCQADSPVVRRYDLATLRLESTAKLPNDLATTKIVIGSGSAGPALMRTDNSQSIALDLSTLHPLSLDGLSQLNADANAMWLSSSADGLLMAIWGGRIVNVSDTGISITQHGHKTTDAIASPDPDGKRIFLGTGSLIASNGELILSRYQEGECWLPAEDISAFFLGVDHPYGPRPKEVQVYESESRTPVLKLEDFEENASYKNSRGPEEALRIKLFAAAGKVISVPPERPEVVVRAIDLPGAMRRSGQPFLYVRSVPPRIAHAGSFLNYAIQVESSNPAGIHYSLAAGPQGMTVEEDGRLTWKVRAEARGRRETVIVQVRDSSGQEISHAFTIAVQ